MYHSAISKLSLVTSFRVFLTLYSQFSRGQKSLGVFNFRRLPSFHGHCHRKTAFFGCKIGGARPTPPPNRHRRDTHAHENTHTFTFPQAHTFTSSTVSVISTCCPRDPMEELPPMFFEVEPSTSRQKSQQMTSAQVRQILAQAVIERLQQWCMQLFWMTVLCVMNCCGESAPDSHKAARHPSLLLKSSTSSRRKRTSVAEIEKKLLRHLTSPYLTSPLRPISRSHKKRVLSRPPSPQLFDIQEED
ncbi:unnamed protein product [Caenorhabditis auriculariae]|uniref:Uncharacterized protein n=1 Tax=Caenorhabditis auriculariae TaxID=2777116 RepID=A0A8S1H8A8_9PELO|nr:unnamed protein product [Caenorhabditis auriculariae]